MKNKFYITTAIHYSSGFPHIGHAYENILTDVIARYKRLLGFDVFFLTGLDEHGLKIAEKAKENNMTNQEWVDHIYNKFIELWKKIDISNDKFIRTTDKYHEECVQKSFSELLKKDYIYLGKWTSLYCIGCEESYTKEEAIQKDDGLYCRVGHKLTTKSEDSYFLKISQFNDWIKDFINSNNDIVIPQFRINEIFNTFLNVGLTDLSISRTSFDWGITINENKNHIIYVWLDALLNYISALGFKQNNDSLFQKYWQSEDSEIVHVVGKDICRFHLIYWPIILKCLDVREFDHVIAHGWIMAEDGRKMSKSFGNVIDPNELVDQYGSDIVRYYLTKEFAIENDNNFSIKNFINLYNSDLANIYGNLVNRFLGMIASYKIDKIIKPTIIKNNLTTELLQQTDKIIDEFENQINNFELSKALHSILTIGNITNKYVQDYAPWTIKDDNEKLNEFLYYLCNNIRKILILLSPVLTKGVKILIKQMNFTDNEIEYSNIKNNDIIKEYSNKQVTNSKNILLNPHATFDAKQHEAKKILNNIVYPKINI